MSGLAVWPIDLDDRDAGCSEESSQARTIRTGALNPDLLDGPEAGQPRQQFAFAVLGCRELFDAQQPADRIQRRRDMHLEMRVDTHP